MHYIPSQLVPIVIHPESHIRPLDRDQASRSFFCLDSAEFGGEWPTTLARIRREVGFLVPIVVVGSRVREHRRVFEEANKAEQAGAIYFERPGGDLKIDDLANNIIQELNRARDVSEPSSRQDNPPILPIQERGNEHEFYAVAPFHWSIDSLQELLARLELRNIDPRKDD